MSIPYVLPTSPTEQFREAMAARDLVPPESILGDGKIHRFSSSGEPKDTAGWYIFFEDDIPNGSFGDFRSGQIVKAWKANIGRDLTHEETESLKTKQHRQHAEREREFAERRAEAKRKAKGILSFSTPAHNNHPYLVAKNVQAYGIREWKGLLAIPMTDETGETQSLQLISQNGEKRFLSGGKMQGCYFPLGKIEGEFILIAEGYATAATIHEATRLPVIVAFNAGNLLAVSQTFREKYPKASIVLCADDDHLTTDNPGIMKSTEAAATIDGKVLAPVFGVNRPDKATDFNDMAKLTGKAAVTSFFISQSLGETGSPIASTSKHPVRGLYFKNMSVSKTLGPHPENPQP